MKSVLAGAAAALICLRAQPTAAADSDEVAQWQAAMSAARWTGPLLASTPETLPQGHFYTEPYVFDVISGGEHHPGSSGFYQYGLLNNFTVGVQPSFAYGLRQTNRGAAIGDFKLLSQLRLTHFTPEHRFPTIALVINMAVPTGRYDRLPASKQGHGEGAVAPEVGINAQRYFLLPNGRLLRGRINVLKSFPLNASVTGRSVYGTGADFRGHARPGSKTTLIAAAEYSLTNEWVLAFDVEADHWARTRVVGRDQPRGLLVTRTSPVSSDIGFAPAIEYNMSPSTGVLLGVWIVPKGHNTTSSVTPAIALSRFW